MWDALIFLIMMQSYPRPSAGSVADTSHQFCSGFGSDNAIQCWCDGGERHLPWLTQCELCIASEECVTCIPYQPGIIPAPDPITRIGHDHCRQRRMSHSEVSTGKEGPYGMVKRRRRLCLEPCAVVELCDGVCQRGRGHRGVCDCGTHTESEDRAERPATTAPQPLIELRDSTCLCVHWLDDDLSLIHI